MVGDIQVVYLSQTQTMGLTLKKLSGVVGTCCREQLILHVWTLNDIKKLSAAGWIFSIFISDWFMSCDLSTQGCYRERENCSGKSDYTVGLWKGPLERPLHTCKEAVRWALCVFCLCKHKSARVCHHHCQQFSWLIFICSHMLNVPGVKRINTQHKQRQECTIYKQHHIICETESNVTQNARLHYTELDFKRG